MAYMHKETFEILQGSNIENYLDDYYFEIDDLIALPVQVLNRKGYKTQACCSGHPFDIVTELFSMENITPGERVGRGKVFKVEEIINEKRPEFKYRVLSRRDTRQCYILFDDNTTLSGLPKGFSIDNRENQNEVTIHNPDGSETKYNPADDKRLKIIYQNFEAQAYKYLTELVEVMQGLYEWALSLPPLTNAY